MNSSFAPKYQKRFGEHWVLWYPISNSYSIVSSPFKILLDDFLKSENINSFKTKVAAEEGVSNSEIITAKIEAYLKGCNQSLKSSDDLPLSFDTSKRTIVKYYALKDKTIRVYFDSEELLKAIHPSIAHLSERSTSRVDATFDVYLKNDQLFLYKDEHLLTCTLKNDYHIIQGKFIMHLLCVLHAKEENDWIGTFHGSTLTDGDSSILFVGESGKGKSTLCALLAHKGFDLLADDVSPMLSETSCIYHNPLAISIKQGAFDLLQPIVHEFDLLPTVNFKKSKGPIKYIACPYPKNDYYPCKAIVLVNYKANSDTRLEPASIKTVLETLIPDSWLSPNATHAKQFLDWLETVNLYQLTYSDTESLTQEVSELFKQLRHNL